MSDVKALQAERNQLFIDLYDGKKPKRIPTFISITWDAAIRYCGMDLKRSQWDNSVTFEFMDKVAQDFPFDKAPVAAQLRHPLHYQLLGSKGIVQSSTGVMQHPEIHSMEVDEYDDFIKDPYKMMVEKFLPRLYSALDTTPEKAMLNFSKAYLAKTESWGNQVRSIGAVTEKYGFASFPPGGSTEAPFDFLADFLRSFTGVSGDVRRMPEKVAAACDALLPHMLKIGLVPTSSQYSRTFIPLHMGPFLNQKQFEKFWWPSFYELMKGLDAAGAGVRLFVESDWMRYLDFLEDLPGRVELQFEYGDEKLIAQKISSKHVVSGLFPITLLSTGTKEQCVDKAKYIIDTLGRDGNYLFNTDKSLFDLRGNIATNLRAVLDTFLTYGVF